MQAGIGGALVGGVVVEDDGRTAVGPRVARCGRPLEYRAAGSKRTTQHYESAFGLERIIQGAQAGMLRWRGGANSGRHLGHRPPVTQNATAVQQGLQHRQQSRDAAGVVEILQREPTGGSHTEHLRRFLANVGESIEPQRDPEPPATATR